jgi:hypothetical protein
MYSSSGLDPYDPRCNRFASEVDCYDSYLEPGQTRAEYCLANEGTLNPENLHFLCDDCYLAAGSPSRPVSEGRWVCP